MSRNEFVDINAFFEKKFTFQHKKEWILPPPKLIFSDGIWNIESLVKLKTELNHAKSLLNDKGEQWHDHTSRISKAALVMESIKERIRPDILTQAWCKFYEILSNYQLISTGVQSIESLHLCEAPGAFISALNCYLCINHPKTNWQWLGNTLNPYYEGQNVKSAIVDDRLLFPTFCNWHFGLDNTGDITNPCYLKDLQEFVGGNACFDLITADGSISCLDYPAQQESIVANLQFAEMQVALYCLRPGANFVIKKFTLFECINICKMYFLNCVFEQVHVFKPFTSKHGNSEVYVICLNYIGLETVTKHLEQFDQFISKEDKALFPLSQIPESFISQMEECSKFFIELQTKAIEENLKLYSIPQTDYKHELLETQKACAKEFLYKCNISYDDAHKIIRLALPKKQILTSFNDTQSRNCKSMYFKAFGETYENLTKSKNMTWEEIILDTDRRLNACFPSNEKRVNGELEWISVWKEIGNRMRTKCYENWPTMGKKLCYIQNSKFCNPLLLHFWNQVSCNGKVKIENHTAKQQCYWDIHALVSLLTDTKETEDFSIVSLTGLGNMDSENDPVLIQLKREFEKISLHNNVQLEHQDINFPKRNKVFYIDSTAWVDSLHQELEIKHRLNDVLKNAIKVLSKEDSLIVIVQSLLTRYTIGIMFILLSLFEKFVCLLPNDVAPSVCGQMWVLKNFKGSEFTDRIIKYMEDISNLEVPENKEILEVVPIRGLCGGYFYEYLLHLNNKHMLQRLQSLTRKEKILLNKSV